jgi:beta-lactamase class D
VAYYSLLRPRFSTEHSLLTMTNLFFHWLPTNWLKALQSCMFLCIGLLCLVACMAFLPVSARETRLHCPSWERYFTETGTSGTFVLYDPQRQTYKIWNEARATTRFLPASTFKIANALIALDTQVTTPDELFIWDKQPRLFPDWERDLTFSQAFQASAVPVFQEVARRIGETRMASYVQKFGYGNQDTSGGIDQFWLTGNMGISALEQIHFLEKLQQERLPVSVEAMRAVRTMMLREETPQYYLYGKTGWSMHKGPELGWWVGWVEKNDKTSPSGKHIYFFALNMDMPRKSSPQDRLLITRKILQAEGILEDSQ